MVTAGAFTIVHFACILSYSILFINMFFSFFISIVTLYFVYASFMPNYQCHFNSHGIYCDLSYIYIILSSFKHMEMEKIEIFEALVLLLVLY